MSERRRSAETFCTPSATGIPQGMGMPVFLPGGGATARRLTPWRRRWRRLLAAAVLASAPLHAANPEAPPYRVQDGSKVDAQTLNGWRTWRALACERCHGKNQEGLVGPSLIESLKTLSKEEFKTTVLKGRLDKGMPNFEGSAMVVGNIDGLYAFLKGRSDGAIQPGRLEALTEESPPATGQSQPKSQ